MNVSGILLLYANILCGVYKGSILGPLQFLIYINDMSGAVSYNRLLYADDSAVLVANYIAE